MSEFFALSWLDVTSRKLTKNNIFTRVCVCVLESKKKTGIQAFLHHSLNGRKREKNCVQVKVLFEFVTHKYLLSVEKDN